MFTLEALAAFALSLLGAAAFFVVLGLLRIAYVLTVRGVRALAYKVIAS